MPTSSANIAKYDNVNTGANTEASSAPIIIALITLGIRLDNKGNPLIVICRKRYVRIAAIKVANVPIKTSIIPKIFTPIMTPTKLVIKHPRVNPKIASGDSSASKVNPSATRTCIFPKLKGASAKLTALYIAAISAILTSELSVSFIVLFL